MKKSKGIIILCILLLTLIVTTVERLYEANLIEFESDSISDEELENKYFYNSLTTESEQKLYKQILHGIREQKDEFNVECDVKYKVKDMFDYVIYDHADIFWCKPGQLDGVEHEGEFLIPGYIEVSPIYDYSSSEVEEMKQEIVENTDEIIALLSEQKSDYEKVKLAFKWIIDNVEYVDDAPHNQNIYSTFVTKETVCAGYAHGLKYLLDQVGVNCIYATGETNASDEESEGHAWNIVECEGVSYIVDATWGEPFERDEELEKYLNDKKLINYEYLCCDYEEISDTHIADESIIYPECVSDDLQYYKNNDMYYTECDEDDIYDALKSSVREKKECTVFQFSDKESYENAIELMKNKLLNKAASYMCDYYGYSFVWWYYQIYNDSNKITVYFYVK